MYFLCHAVLCLYSAAKYSYNKILFTAYGVSVAGFIRFTLNSCCWGYLLRVLYDLRLTAVAEVSHVISWEIRRRNFTRIPGTAWNGIASQNHHDMCIKTLAHHFSCNHSAFHQNGSFSHITVRDISANTAIFLEPRKLTDISVNTSMFRLQSINSRPLTNAFQPKQKHSKSNEITGHNRHSYLKIKLSIVKFMSYSLSNQALNYKNMYFAEVLVI